MDEDPVLGPTVALRGVCRFTPERAQRGFRLNQFLTGMRQPQQRALFTSDPEACMAAYGLSEAERDMVRRRDYSAMLDYGASNVALGKASPALGTTLLERGALGRGQTPGQFIAERQAANQGYPWHS
jgi:gallate dioxygenase